MYKYLLILLAAIAVTSCGEYQRVLKSNDADYRLDFAKRAFEEKNTLRPQPRSKTSPRYSKAPRKPKTPSSCSLSPTMKTRTTRPPAHISSNIIHATPKASTPSWPASTQATATISTRPTLSSTSPAPSKPYRSFRLFSTTSRAATKYPLPRTPSSSSRTNSPSSSLKTPSSTTTSAPISATTTKAASS